MSRVVAIVKRWMVEGGDAAKGAIPKGRKELNQVSDEKSKRENDASQAGTGGSMAAPPVQIGEERVV